MRNLGPEADELCRFCQGEEETAIYLLYEGLIKVRLFQLGREKSGTSKFMKGRLPGLWDLIKRIKLDRVL